MTTAFGLLVSIFLKSSNASGSRKSIGRKFSLSTNWRAALNDENISFNSILKPKLFNTLYRWDLDSLVVFVTNLILNKCLSLSLCWWVFDLKKKLFVSILKITFVKHLESYWLFHFQSEVFRSDQLKQLSNVSSIFCVQFNKSGVLIIQNRFFLIIFKLKFSHNLNKHNFFYFLFNIWK